MLKSFLFAAAALCLSSASYAQNTFPASGNAGVGTQETSFSPLTIQADVAKTSDVLTKILELKTNESFFNNNPFKLTFYVNGKTSLPERSWYLQTGDHGITNGGNLLLQSLGGKVGLGVTNPRAVLDVGKPLAYGEVGTVLARLGEGDTQNEGTSLNVRGYDTQLSNGVTDYRNIKSFAIEHQFYGSKNSAINFYRGLNAEDGSMALSTNNADRLKILNNGNVLVGKIDQINSTYKLDVAGSVRANEIVVNTTGADFVFEPTYQLRSLPQLNTYIKANRHLPGIPSAVAMQQNGVEIGEMNKKLLQKVEELTLYLIEKDGELKQQRLKDREQEKRIKVLENKLFNH